MSNYIASSGNKITIGHLNNNYFNKLLCMLGEYGTLFTSELDPYTFNNQVECTIKTLESAPIYIKSILSDNEKILLRQRLNELLAGGRIKYSTSAWSFPAQPIKMNNRIEIMVDYSSLNNITYDSGYYIPTTEEIINSIPSCNIFSKILIKDGLHQLRLNENSQHLTAFQTDFGHFEFKTHHHGLKNSEADLQYAINLSLYGVDFQYVKVYLDEILVHTHNDFDLHLNIINDILRNLRNSNFKLDVNKSCFLLDKVIFVGKQINSYGISIDPRKVHRIINFPIPSSKKEVDLFLDQVSRFKNHLLYFDHYAQPLYHLSSSDEFYWDTNLQNSFLALKNLLNSVDYLKRF